MPRLTRARTLEFITIDGPISSEQGIGFEGIYNQETASAYIRRHLDRLDVDGFESLLRLYNGLSKQGRKWFGGASTVHPKIQAFIDALDSFHDYHELDLEPVELPKGAPLQHRWKEEWEVIRYFASMRAMIFGKETVENQMFGAKLWAEFDYPNDEPDINALCQSHERSVQNRLTQVKDRILPLDIPVFKYKHEKQRKTLRFRSVVLTAHAMATWFGEEAKFLIDGYDESLVTYFTGFCEISNVLALGFRTSKQLKFVKKAIREAHDLNFSRWASDANFWDAAPIAQYVSIDMQPTGKVNETVELNGIAENGVTVNLTLAGEKRSFTKDQCERLSSKRNMINFVRGEYTVQQLKDMKRAGDRGQVLHAKKYGYVIVTRDKFMALYAYALNVPFLFIRRRRPADYDHPFVELQSWLLCRG